MADGMFITPEEIRARRADEILRQYQNTAMMGGSMDQLLGQVAAAGSNVGSLMAESGARMFGLQTPEEARAAQLQQASKGINWDNPEDLTQMAKYLNDVGMTEQALKVLEKRNVLLDRQYTEQQRERAEEDRQYDKARRIGEKQSYNVYVEKMVNIGSAKEPMYVTQKMPVQVVEEWQGKDKGWVVISDPRNQESGLGGNPRKEWLEQQAKKLEGSSAPSTTKAVPSNSAVDGAIFPEGYNTGRDY